MACSQWKMTVSVGILFSICVAYEIAAYQINGPDCGRTALGAGQTKARIVGGLYARRSQHPWVVNLKAYFVGNRMIPSAMPCGGTLITYRFVLTAAHCVLRALDNGRGSLASIVEVYYSERGQRKGCVRRARDIIVHPGFDHFTRLHDVAIIRLFKPVPRSTRTRPICLISRREVLMGKLATVLGWGWPAKNKPLRYVNVKVVPFKTCQRKLDDVRKRKVLTNKTMICTAGVKKGPCKGDGGGPVIMRRNSRMYQVGVISFPKSCDTSRDIPSAHARVDYYYEWIRRVVASYSNWSNGGKAVGPPINVRRPPRRDAPAR